MIWVMTDGQHNKDYERFMHCEGPKRGPLPDGKHHICIPREFLPKQMCHQAWYHKNMGDMRPDQSILIE